MGNLPEIKSILSYLILSYLILTFTLMTFAFYHINSLSYKSMLRFIDNKCCTDIPTEGNTSSL